MKKYLHYDVTQFSLPRTDIGVRVPSRPSPVSQVGGEHDVLDLSAKVEVNVGPTGASRAWGEEQNALPLDLSGYTRQQDEALDLTKPATPKSRNNGFNQSPHLSHPIDQSKLSSHVLQSSVHSKSPLNQSYSLLQAALNSSQSDAGLLERVSQAGVLADNQSLLFEGDASRGIKPFTSTRPLGISVPHMAFGTNSGAIIPGPKPIAITTPQPHNPPINTKSQSVSDTTVSVTVSNQSISSTSNDGYAVSQPSYSNVYHGQIISKKLGVAKAFSQNTNIEKGERVERYMLQNPDGFPAHLLSRPNIIHQDILSGFSCTQCHKIFKTKAAMKLHMTVHKTTEERQYGCQVCGRRFLHRHHLVVHQRKHSGEKPFKCNACNKTFMAIFLLHKHLRKHTRETGAISDVSVEQLKQLQEQKLISSGPQPLTYNNVPPLKNSNPPILENEYSIRSMKSPEEIERKVGEVLGEINKDPNHGGVVLPVKACVPYHQSSNIPFNILPQTFKVEPADTNASNVQNPAISNVCEDSNKQDSDGPNITKADDQNNSVTCSLKIETDDSGGKVERVINPFPEYNSDDEVDLDPYTGEMIVTKSSKTQESVKDENVEETGANVEETGANVEDTGAKDVGEVKSEPMCVKEEIDIDDKITERMTEDEKIEEELKEIDKKVTSAVERQESVQTLSRSISSDIDDDKQYEVSVIAEWNKIDDKIEEVMESEIDSEANTTDLDVDKKCAEIFKREESDCEVDTKEPESVKEMTEIVCEEEKLTTEITDPVVEAQSKSEGVTGIGGDNIFEKMYESVNVGNVIETETVKKKRGKKKRGRKVKCEICSRKFHSDHYLLLHMAVHKRNPMLQSLKKAKANQIKAMGFVNKMNVVCTVCNKAFKFQKSLNSHMRVHSEKLMERKLYRKAFRDFVSGGKPQCVKQSRKSVGSESQNKISEESRRLSLESFTSETLEKKENIVSPSSVTVDIEPPIKVLIGEDNVKRYMCYACDNTYTTKQKLRLHALIHKDNCFLCDICGKSFYRQLTLDKHISTHRLPRPHICEFCKKSFIHRSSLMRHKTTHQKPSGPSTTLNVADINFELKMRDTYSILKEERNKQIRKQFSKAAAGKHPPKYDPLDLTLKIRPDEQCLPPVLSPANISTSSQSSSWNLSPPLITEDPANYERALPSEMDRQEMIKAAKLSVKRKSRGESGCSESTMSDTMTSDGKTPPGKKSRKTRVYQTSCRVCKEVFPNVMTLKTHMSLHNTVETHPYECHICRHRFTQSCSLLRHLKTSCQDNKLKCVPCNKTFHRRNTFEQHMKLHEGGPEGGASTLDGSFYDKRKDEAEVREERESDIENNNSSKTTDVTVTPLTLENVALFEKATGTETKVDEDDGNETDSDAQTYLYAEGEIHSRISDFSDNEGDAANGQQNNAVPQDLSKQSNSMTLNLLSAVCSELRNAEKEEEEKRREFEEKQKELETIEILANLKRGAMQKTAVEIPPVSLVGIPSNNSTPINTSTPIIPSTPINTSTPMNNSTPIRLPVSIINPPKQMTPISKFNETLPVSKTHLKTTTDVIREVIKKQPIMAEKGLLQMSNHVPAAKLVHPYRDYHPIFSIPSMLDSALGGQMKIPTVVHEPPKSKPTPARRGRPPASSPPNPSPVSMQQTQPSRKFDLPNPPLVVHKEFPPNLRHPGPPVTAIHERLSLLMKAQVTAPQSSLPPAQVTPAAIRAFPSGVRPTLSPSTTYSRAPVTNASLEHDAPQDLSVKKIKTEPTPTAAPYIPRSIPTQSMKLPVDTKGAESRPVISQPDHLMIPTSEGRPIVSQPDRLMMPTSEFDPRLDPRRLPGSMPPIPPPLVSVYQCDLCPKVVYNKIDLHLHRVEHAKEMGIEVLSGKKPILKTEEQKHPEKPVDYTQAIGRSAHHPPSQTVPHQPLSSPLSLASEKQVYLSSIAQSSASSDSDSSCSTGKHPLKLTMPSITGESIDGLCSPSQLTPGNLDQLRQDLRHKIFSRRKSQGLEDLKVEFKQPEPTELSEEERLKLLYRRECNRQAAQRSRMRKKDLVDNLLERLGEMPSHSHKDRLDQPKDEPDQNDTSDVNKPTASI